MYAVDYVYTLRDAFSDAGLTMPLSVFAISKTETKSLIISFFDEIFSTSSSTTETDYIEDTYFVTLMYEGILSEYLDSVIGGITKYFAYYLDEDSLDDNAPDSDEIREKVSAPFLNSLFTTYAQTRSKYIAMIDSLAYIDNQLADGFMTRPGSSSATTNKYSDTPQDTDNEDTLIGDAHLTNVSRTESEVASDGASPAARFDEVAQKIRNIYMEWAREFEPIFMHDRGSR